MIDTVLFVVLAAAAFAAGWLAVRAMTREADAEHDREADRLKRVAELSIEEAAGRARAILREGSRVAGVEAAESTRPLPDIGPEARELLRAYESIRSVPDGDMLIDRSLFGPSELRPGYVRIGRIAAGTDAEGELCMRPGEEPVYEVYEGEKPDPVFGTYGSIHHLIIAVAGEGDGHVD